MSRKLYSAALTALLLMAFASGLHAQFGTGDLGQQTRRGMEQAFDNLLNDGMSMPDPQSLGEIVGQEKVDAFLENAVVKLTFMPDGAYKASALEGGEVIFFKLGKAKFTPAEDEEYDEGWLTRLGEYEAPKKAQKLIMKLKAGPTEVDVTCHNKYGPSEQPVTFYVGPLDGLFCVGFTEGVEPEGEMG
jgi:hypothetical protein